jgi:hypothetical protein
MALIEEIKNIKGNKSDWKKFGITMGIILVVIACCLLWKKNNSFPYVFVLAAAFLITGIVVPSMLKPVYKAWMVLSVMMGYIMTRIIMAVIFYLIVTPIGFLAALVGKNFLDMKIDKKAKSYWKARDALRKEKSDYERQF